MSRTRLWVAFRAVSIVIVAAPGGRTCARPRLRRARRLLSCLLVPIAFQVTFQIAATHLTSAPVLAQARSGDQHHQPHRGETRVASLTFQGVQGVSVADLRNAIVTKTSSRWPC